MYFLTLIPKSMKTIVLILVGSALCLISCSKNEESVFFTQSGIIEDNNPLKTRHAIFEDSVDVIPFSQSIGESFRGVFSYRNRNYNVQFDYRYNAQGQITEAYAGAFGRNIFNLTQAAEIFNLGSKAIFYSTDWMEFIIKCNYAEFYVLNQEDYLVYYTVKERLTLLAKYNRITNEYSCVVMGKENGFWDPREELFP